MESIVRYLVVLPDGQCCWTEGERLPEIGDTIRGDRGWAARPSSVAALSRTRATDRHRFVDLVLYRA